MRRIMILIVLTALMLTNVASGFCSNRDEVFRQVCNLLYSYKDAYNARDLNAIKKLYDSKATLRSFPLQSKETLKYNEFCNLLPEMIESCSELGFKLNLFKVISFEIEGDKAEAEVRWKYRTQEKKNTFTPTFIVLNTPGGWKILSEDYKGSKK